MNEKTVAFHSLGCKVNSYETDIMLQKFGEKGYRIVHFDQKADVYVINTCTVTQIADKKSRQMIRRARRKHPEALIVAVGCFVETSLKDGGDTGSVEALKEATGADLVLGNLQKGRIVEIVEQALSSGEQEAVLVMPRDAAPPDAVCGQILTEAPAFHTRAFLKVQDGCDQFCSYCVIPYARGRIRSRDADEVVTEVRGLAAQGVREIVLTGIHLSSYGQKKPGIFDGEALIDLIQRIGDLPGVARIRLGSLEPRLITAKTAEALGELCAAGKLCPHFHLSLQSGSDAVLARMNRHYTAGQYAESVELLRGFIDRPALTTDVITGFPGETEETFAETEAFLRKLGLYELHVFPYSERDGTVAASLPGRVPHAVREARSWKLLDLTAAQSRQFREQFVGERMEVLWEEETVIGGVEVLTGFTSRYIRAAIPVTMAAKAGAAQGEISVCRAVRMLDAETLLGE